MTWAKRIVVAVAMAVSLTGPIWADGGFETRQLTADFVGEGGAVADIDRDGVLDLIAGSHWYQGPSFDQKFTFTNDRKFKTKSYSDKFFIFADDLDRDGWTDLIVVGFPWRAAHWYRNPGEPKANQMWEKSLFAKVVGNESPLWTDINGDGHRELICGFSADVYGYYSPKGLTGEALKGLWPSVTLAPKTKNTPAQSERFIAMNPNDAKRKRAGRPHGLGVGDLNGDGRLDLLTYSGWWEQPEQGGVSGGLPGASVPGASWLYHPYNFGFGGADMLVDDFDADGDNDVISSISGHGYGLYWFEQIKVDGQITFKAHELMGDQPAAPYDFVISQLHAFALADVDRDGAMDFVTGKRYYAHNGHDPGASMPAVLYWFRTVRSDQGVTFEPHLIHADSGVGTDIVVTDVTGDGRVDVLGVSKKGVYLHRQIDARQVVGKPGILKTPKEAEPVSDASSPDASSSVSLAKTALLKAGSVKKDSCCSDH